MTGDRLTRGVAYVAVEATHVSAEEMLARRNFQPRIARLAKVGLGKALQPLVPGHIDMAGVTYKRVGAGGEQVVYSNGLEVVKVIHKSLTFHRGSAETAANRHARTYDVAAAHMGEHVIPTEFDVRRVRAGLFAAIAIQPHVAIKESFRDVDHLVDYCGDPAHITALEKFYDALIRLYEASGIQMDLNGPGNIALLDCENPLLAMIDTLPVGPDMQQIVNPESHIRLGDQLLGRMGVIGNALALTTE